MRNEGFDPATNIVLTNIAPKEVKVISASGPAEYTIIENTVQFAPVAVLQSGERLVYKIVCKVISPGEGINVMKLKYKEFDGELITEEPTTFYK